MWLRDLGLEEVRNSERLQVAWGWGNCLGTIVYNRGGTAKASLFLHRSKEIQGREVCPVRCTYIIGSPGPELRLKREKKPRTGKELHASSVPHSGSNFSAGALWWRPPPHSWCPAPSSTHVRFTKFSPVQKRECHQAT